MTTRTLAIIIPAWRCEGFIMGCIHSIWAQTPVPGWKIEHYIGVDACPKTSEMLTQYRIPHYYFPVNIGHYVMRNSMIKLHKADAYFYFDADDAMKKNCCARILANIDKTGLVVPGKINTDIGLHPKTGQAVVENGGAMAFTQAVLDAVGGFRSYVCAADTDFLRRAEMAGFRVFELKEPLYLRRSHPLALTKNWKTGMKSAYRKSAWKEMTALRAKGIIKIEPQTVGLVKREGDY